MYIHRPPDSLHQAEVGANLQSVRRRTTVRIARTTELSMGVVERRWSREGEKGGVVRGVGAVAGRGIEHGIIQCTALLTRI